MNAPIEHIGLSARDPVRLRDWYVQVLDAREVYNNGERRPAFLLRTVGGPMLEIYPGEPADAAPGHNQQPGWRHLALRVASIEAGRRELEARGVVFQEAIKPAGGGGRVLFFRDPEGNLLHLVERPSGSGWPGLPAGPAAT